MRSLKNEIYNVLKPAFSRKGEVFAEIMLKWSEIVGFEYSIKLIPLNIQQYQTTNETVTYLIVKCSSPASALLLNFSQNQIIERINGYFGFLAVNKLKIKP